MSENYDRKIEKILLNTVENVRAFNHQAIGKKENDMWKEIKLPCSINEAISVLKKNELDTIRKNLELKNLSTLKKAELISTLNLLIPIFLEDTIKKFDRNLFELIKTIVQNNGSVQIQNVNIEQTTIKKLREYSIVFTGSLNGQKVLFMPDELIKRYDLFDLRNLENIIQRNTEWIHLTQGMLYYYGVMDLWRLIKKIESYTEQKINIDEYLDVIFFASNIYGIIEPSSYGYKDARLEKSKPLIEEQYKRSNLDYYPFTKKQLLAVGNSGNNYLSTEMKLFMDFLKQHYQLSNNEINQLSAHLTKMINTEPKFTTIIEYLQTWFEFPSFEFVQILTSKLTDLYNSTPQWILKGHTPNELFQEERKYLKPLPPKKQSDNKIGRNDPCPCGSGKKYKKCCGK